MNMYIFQTAHLFYYQLLSFSVSESYRSAKQQVKGMLVAERSGKVQSRRGAFR